MLVALEIEHAVDHVLEHLRPRDGALLVDVADHEHRDPLSLRQLHERHRAVLHLPDAARRRIQLLVIERLDRVDDQDVGLFLLYALKNISQASLGQDEQPRALNLQALGAELELVGRTPHRRHTAPSQTPPDCGRSGASASTCRCPARRPRAPSEPLTAPPPRTRSSSPMPVEKRISSAVSISVMGDASTALAAAALRLPLAVLLSTCSTMEIHAPHALHRARPLRALVARSLPLQKKTVFAFILSLFRTVLQQPGQNGRGQPPLVLLGLQMRGFLVV